MSLNETLVDRLEASREKMTAHLNQIDRDRKIYPLWTIREILAHLSGWDDSTIAFIHAVVAGKIPPTPATRGIDVYNAETVTTREGLDYDHVYREYLETRRVLLDEIRKLPENKLTEKSYLPWGEQGSLVDLIDIFASHEETHADDVEKIIASAREIEQNYSSKPH